MATTDYPHILLIGDNVPILSGTTTKVIEVVLDHVAHHWDADEIRRQHPHLSLAQIHSALVYYYDHQAEMDGEIDRTIRASEDIRSRLGDGPLTAKGISDRLP
jgi:uncharacterized protein (DUF433 family)